MAIRFDKLWEGMTLYDCHTQAMGNTTMSELCLWEVKVISIDRDQRTAMCSWNHNHPRLYTERSFKSLSAKIPKRYTDQQERRRRSGRL